MAYEKLKLTDFVSKWTAADVDHLENGILNAEGLFTKYMNMSYDEKQKLTSNILQAFNDLDYDKRNSVQNILNNVFSDYLDDDKKASWRHKFDAASVLGANATAGVLWGGLLSELGRRCGTPSFSWDGDITNKVLMPSDALDIAYYVKISDDATYKFNEGCITFAGLSVPILVAMATMKLVENVNDNDTAFYQALMIAVETCFAFPNENRDELYSILWNELIEMPYPVMKVLSTDTEIDGIIYPKGIYALTLMSANLMGEDTVAPVSYVDKYWNIYHLANPIVSNNLNWDYIDFHTDMAVDIKDNSILWDGNSTLPAARIYDLEDDSYLTLISYKTKEFFDLVKKAASITTTWSNGTTTSSIEALNEKSLYVVGGLSLYIALDFFTIKNEETGSVIYSIPPGVYLHASNTGTYPKEITFNGVSNMESILYSHKLPHKLYDCPAYEEVHTIPGLTLKYKYNINDDNININFTDLNNAFNYHKLYDNPLILDDLKQVEITQPDIVDYSIEESTWGANGKTLYPFILGDDGYYISTNQGIPDSVSSCNVRIKSNSAAFKIEVIVSGEDSYDHGAISGVMNDSSTGGCWGYYETGTHVLTYENIAADSYINIQYLKDDSENRNEDCLRFRIIYNDVKDDILNSEQQTNVEIIELSPSIQALRMNNVNQSLYCYPLLNVLENTEFEGIALTKGIYSITVTPSIIPYYISKISTIDKYNITIHKIDEKFLPGIPTFNLQEMGMENIIINNGMIWLHNIDLTQLRQAAQKGPIKIITTVTENDISVNMETIFNMNLSPLGCQSDMLQRMSNSLYRVEFGFSGKTDDDEDIGSIWYEISSMPSFNSSQTAQVGQILSVKAIDENGKPIEWEVVDLPKAAAVEDAADLTVTATEFNALLASLRAAGLLEI